MKVLIVDDEADLRFYLSELVQAVGHTPLEAGSTEEGLRFFAEHSPQMVICDLNINGDGGLVLLEKVRESDTEVIFVLMTAMGSEASAVRALELKANNYLAKPIRWEVVSSLIEKYDRILLNKSRQKEVEGMISRRELTLTISNRLELVSEVANFLVAETNGFIPQRDRFGVHLGLYELIINAIEHGNLGISYYEKRRCLLEGPHRLKDLVRRRSEEPHRLDRRVIIDFHMDSSRCEWTIQDQGDGFNWSEIPNPLEDEGEAVNGRGIFLAKYQFDEVSFLGTGNKVRIVKYLPEDKDLADGNN